MSHAQRLAVEFVAAGRGVARVLLGDHQVELARPHGGERALGLALGDLDPKRRVLEGEKRECLRDDSERRRLEDGEAYRSGRAAAERRQFGLEQLDTFEQGGGVLDEQFGGGGEPHPAARLDEQRHVRSRSRGCESCCETADGL